MDALLATKLYAPQLRSGLVARPQLLRRMEDGAQARLTLVSAPAGFGKTTVVAAWLHPAQAADRRVAWLSLDAADNDPRIFWTYVVTALRAAVPGLDSTALLNLLAANPLATPLLVTALLNQLAALADEVWLVLDDYHLVDEHEIGQQMAFLLEHLPPRVHVVISTRADPDLPLARWRAQRELVEIRVSDLRFTSEETAAYLSAAIDQELTAGDIEILEERTEGWIAALQLAALSLQDRPDVSGFIARFAGDDRYIVDYLIEEVLTHLPIDVRDFLMQSAILDRLTGPLCDTLTGRDDAADMLASLERANLFIVSLDDRREWYRYHHLFADVLRARMLSEQPMQLPLLHRRASEWYEAHELAEDAIRHALAARDFDRAVHLIELSMPAIRRHRQEAMMYGWLRSLPNDAVRRSPVLSVFFGDMLMHAGDLDAAATRLDDAEQALAGVPGGEARPGADTTELRTLPATIAIYRASLAQARGDAAGTAEHARRALDLAGPDDHLARAGAAGFLGLAAWAQGDVPRALETFGQAVASLHAAGNLIDELSSTVVLADLWLAAGRPSKARRLCESALRRAEAEGLSRAVADLHVGLSEIDLAVGDRGGARGHLQAAVAPGERAGPNEGRHRWFVAQSLLAQADGQLDEAATFLDHAAELYRPGFFPDVRPIAALRARVWIAQDKLADAADWASERGLSVTDEVVYLREFEHLTLVRILLAQRRANPGTDALDQATTLLDRLFAAAQSAGRDGSLHEIRLLQAQVTDAQGRRPQAHEVAQAGRPVDGGTRPAATLLSDREIDVLRLLDSALTGPEIARRLFLSHNTVRTHTKHIYTKLDVTSRRAAVLRARDHGLL